MSCKKILVVDDNAIIRKTIALKLKTNGYEVLMAEDGASAVNCARRQKPDLILLDISFPPDVPHGGGVRWDGFLLMNWLQRLEEARSIPVVIITGSQDEKHKVRALASGAVSFFQKPIDHEALLATIRQTLGETHKVSQPAAPNLSKPVAADVRRL